MKQIDPLQLLAEAKKAAKRAYAPYSKYRVGAALLTANGTIFQGCNVENASYGLTVCAERIALFSAIAAGHKKFKALAIVASGRKAPSPCGACRQVFAEFCQPGFPVYFATKNNLRKFRSMPLSKLLPATFKL
ncbi:MAG: cytidine deaminase [Kiritimatiellae bacterium]|nr:cytidine deaminase [Kiritimatiellia bacterium]